MSGRNFATLIMASAAGAGSVVFAWVLGGGITYLLVPVVIFAVFASRAGAGK